MTHQLMTIRQVSVQNRLISLTASIQQGEQIHLIGPNGSGKSTLLACMAGILPYSGKICLQQKCLSEYRHRELARHRAWFSQQVSSVPIMPVFQYLQLYLASPPVKGGVLPELCSFFKLGMLLETPVGRLSGGEWQRVRLAGVFLQVWSSINLEGKLLLLDEPTNNLDIAQVAALDLLVKKFCELGGSVVMSGHDLNHSYDRADRIWLLADGQLVADGKPDEVMKENTLSKVFAADIKCVSENTYKYWRVFLPHYNSV
ncbi:MULTISPECIES: vitamin B12 ABC transporter ATP-binding protein BtuD [Photorhabdus]|uniref:Vitamin B12 import ATP-binding protein BtuD n=2 Tax=Photorhabdus asymbiotica TaxID=291112 RepID=C7BHL9_PHOAA|nr:vitamin B12 transport system ATP-binding protein [Photorhabdus asymbiotica]CAQ83966.1 vitamin B12 import ATP-binding protein [Photorhabdus asymbiotica]